MVTAVRTDGGAYPRPTMIGDGPALAEEHRYDADGTAYRVLVVDLGDHEVLVLAEPVVAGNGAKRFMALNDTNGALSQDYIGAMLGFEDWRHIDCRNLTVLIGFALMRPVLVVGQNGTYERREPDASD